MDFRDLNYVLAVAKHQNITKAAESLHITQPTLSKFLLNLEKDLGQPLFRRLGHKYLLTFAGECYIKSAQEILLIKNNLDTELDDILKKNVGVINVAFSRMRCTYMLPGILPKFQNIYPNIQVNVFEGSSNENDQRLLNGQAEIAFYSKPQTPNPLLEYNHLRTEEMLICTPKDHPIKQFAEPNPNSRYPRLNPALLKNELIIQLLPEQRTRQITDVYFKEHNLKFDKVMYTSSLPAIMELVSIGYGVSFIFETHLLHHHFSQPIDCYSFGNPKMLSDFVVASRKNSYLSSYINDFIEIARDLMNNSQPLDFNNTL